MSHKATDWAIEVVEGSDLTVSARYILILLADAHNRHNGDCFPSIAFIMRKTGLSESAVKVAIRQLEAADLLSREVLPHNDGRRTKGVQYHLRLERVRVRTPGCEPPQEGFADEPTGVRTQPPSKDNLENNRKDNRSSLRSEPARAQNLISGNVVRLKQKTRLTEAFTLTDERLAKGVAKGLSEEETCHEFGKFQDHFIGNGTAWVDWDRCWSKWLSTAVERGSRKVAYGGGGREAPTVFRAAERLIARIQAARGDDGGHEMDLPF